MSFEPELIIKREALEKAQTTNFGFDWDYEKLKEEDYEVKYKAIREQSAKVQKTLAKWEEALVQTKSQSK